MQPQTDDQELSNFANTTVPVLETDRLILRGHRPDDFTDFAAIWGDPAVARYISGRPASRNEAWLKFLRNPGIWAFLGYGYWVIEEKASQTVVGEAGFADFKRGVDPRLDGKPEMGWVLKSEVHGKGYASEAVKAALVWGTERFEGGAVVCLIDPENKPSLRIAEKFGFQEFARATYMDTPVILFSRQES